MSDRPIEERLRGPWRHLATLGLIAAVGALPHAAPVAAAETAVPGPPAWRPFDAGPDCRCADGSEVHFHERVADPTRVVLYLEGGGACWSAETCAFEGEEMTYIASSAWVAEMLPHRGGIFDASDPRNPLAGHTFVYVPYCTGDAQLGTVTRRYSDELTVEHKGFVNASAALDHLVASYPDVTELIVAGVSAGSIPVPLFAGLAAERLPAARIVALGDSSGGFPDDPMLNIAIGSLWGTAETIPDWPATADVDHEDWSIPALTSYAGRHAPRITFARFDHASDDVQAYYGRLAGAASRDIAAQLVANEAAIEAEGVVVASYVAPGDAHTILGEDVFYDLEVEGVRLVDWVTELIDGRTPADVRCPECSAEVGVDATHPDQPLARVQQPA